MEQFRKLGEALGSLRALMVFRDEIRINQRQCCLLADAFGLAFDSVADEIHRHLKPPDAKWKPLDHPLKELIRIFRDGEHYIRQCLEARDWWARALSMGPNAESVELHLHNLLWCLPVVFEAVETSAESSDNDDAANNRFVFSKKYEREWMEPNLFRQKFGRKYLAFDEFVRRLDTAWKEDQWLLSETITAEKRKNRLSDLLRGPRGKLHPCSALVGSPELYQVRRRLGSGSSYKEIQWMGESFAVKHVIGDVESAKREIEVLSAVSHPNTMNCLYAFCDEEKRECFLVMDLMSKDLSSYIKETCGPRKRVPFSLLVAVDVMLQIARGMEYLHARKIFHGELNPSNVLVKPRTNSSQDGYLLVKVAGFGLSPGKNSKSPTSSTTTTTTTNPCIWYSPEALAEQEQSPTGPNHCKFTEKSDVYSFAMICFELLTGKIPFEDGHLQGDRMSKNIRAGERPLFPFPSPKYLTGLTKRCWQTDPSLRPSFTCICRVLRYIKRFLILNPDHGQQDPQLVPPVDYFELEIGLSKNVGNWARKEVVPASEVPFQMYAYRIIEREKTNLNVKERSSESGSEEASVCGDETPVIVEDPSPTDSSNSARSSAQSQTSSDGSKKGSTTKKVDGKSNKKTGQQLQKPKPVRTPQISCGRSMRMKPESQLRTAVMSPGGRRLSGHASDSELA